MTSDDLFSLLETSGDAAFVTDSTGRIVYWGPSAVAALDLSRKTCEGRFCWEVLGSGSADETTVCRPNCPSLAAAGQLKAVPARELCLRTQTNDRWFSVSFLGAPLDDRGRPLVVHLCRDIDSTKRLSQAVADCVDNLHRISELSRPLVDAVALSLTRREAEVLRLCARGLSSRKIADTLGVAPATARNHVQNILEKLECHTRVEAILKARARGLI